MFPQRTAALEHPDLNVRNVEMHGVGHMTLPIIAASCTGSGALAHLDSDGHTLTPGRRAAGDESPLAIRTPVIRLVWVLRTGDPDRRKRDETPLRS